MRIYEVVDESIETMKGLTKDQKDAIGGRGKYKPKKPTPTPMAGQRSYHNYMQRGPALNRPSMTSKQYGKGNVGLT